MHVGPLWYADGLPEQETWLDIKLLVEKNTLYIQARGGV